MMHFVFIAGLVTGMLLPEAADALTLPGAPCTGLVGCGGSGANVIAENAPEVLEWMVRIASMAALLFIVWAGFNLVWQPTLDESKASQYRMGVIYALAGLALVISSQVLVKFAATQPWTAGGDTVVTDLFGNAVGILLTLLNAALGVVIILNGIRMLYARGKGDEFQKAQTALFWAVIGALVVNAANAILQGFLVLLNP